jgi:hypothetical protein
MALRFFVVLSEGEHARAARTVLATGDEEVVREVVAALARRLGVAVPLGRRASATLHTVKPTGGDAA